MNRRHFLATMTAAPAFAFQAADNAPRFTTANRRWQATYDSALTILAGNVQVMPRYDKPVLIEGSSYQGIWMECGPLEALVYRKFRPDAARASHLTFFELQREDGQFPANNKTTEAGFGQIQVVVPIAATAWELAQATGDDEVLRTTYRACSAWDTWLVRRRNVRGTGLTEGFCTYDTGHDNSPRWAGIPNQCPDKDAAKYPPIPSLPRLCPDLSATTYGARVALAAMAKALGKAAEAAQWTESAEKIRSLILSRLYVAQDAAFYDLDAQDRFVKVRTDILSRVCGEQVPSQALFEELWTRQIHNPKAFWGAYPLPSVALDDPLFVRPIPRNSWGGASQALTALRAGRWFEHYNRAAEFSTMMDRWCDAIQRDPAMRQQLDPLTGDFTEEGAAGYSPCALVMLEYTWRLAGVCDQPDALHWNVRPGHPAADSATFRMRTDGGHDAEMRYARQGCDLRLAGKSLGRIEGGAARLITDRSGIPKALLGIAETPQKVTVDLAGRPPRKFDLAPNRRIDL